MSEAMEDPFVFAAKAQLYARDVAKRESAENGIPLVGYALPVSDAHRPTYAIQIYPAEFVHCVGATWDAEYKDSRRAWSRIGPEAQGEWCRVFDRFMKIEKKRREPCTT